MSEKINPLKDYVFALSADDFLKLKEAINIREDKEKYGFTSFEEAAVFYKRKPFCPCCGSAEYISDGHTPSGHIRYRCQTCDKSYTLLSDSIFNSAKISLHKLMSYIQLMSFNVPLQLLCEALDISSNTAELWRKKIFESVDGYQDHLKLSDTVWIDETYMEDYEVLAKKDGKRLRGLSRSKICIVVAIDIHKNMVAIISGHGKPSSGRIMAALESHITEGSHIIHDGDHSHYKLIEKLRCTEEVYKANSNDSFYLEHMRFINNMCGWLKRYIWRFIGMDIHNLQSYLNWFIYIHRVDNYKDRWPKTTRILRHLVLSKARLTRKY